MKVVEISTRFNAPPARIWEEVNKPRLMLFVAAPFIRFDPHEPPSLPDRWQETDYVLRTWLFRVLPVGKQTISLSRPLAGPNANMLRDTGHSAMIRRWDHLMTVEADGNGTRYSDRIEIEAGILTAPLAVFARWFFAHRHRRWQDLVEADFDYARL